MYIYIYIYIYIQCSMSVIMFFKETILDSIYYVIICRNCISRLYINFSSILDSLFKIYIGQ